MQFVIAVTTVTVWLTLQRITDLQSPASKATPRNPILQRRGPDQGSQSVLDCRTYQVLKPVENISPSMSRFVHECALLSKPTQCPFMSGNESDVLA